MITTCTKCGCAYDERSEESANEPNRKCLKCYQAEKEMVITKADEPQEKQP